MTEDSSSLETPLLADGSILDRTLESSGEPKTTAGYTLSFDNLSVHVPGRKKKWYHTLGRPLQYVLEEYAGLSIAERDPLFALNNVSGLLASGELCLVLGSNDESKSTLLRSLCGRLSEQDKQSGTIALNGLPMTESYQGFRRMCPYVGPGDNDHSPVLTVRETFEFARRCTASDDTSEATIKTDVDSLMRILGLDHVADTVVGDENLRGISGGQKRRVTVGEMMLDRLSKFCMMENITDGLSSNDSNKLIQDLADGCRKNGMSAFVSLLQPSDEMVEKFDKLLILSSGGDMLYFGSCDRDLLRSIFLSPDNPDGDKGSIADLVLQASLDKTGEMENAIRQRFEESSTAAQLTAAISKLRRTSAKGMGVEDLLPHDYPNSFGYRFKVISERRMKLIGRNAVTWTRIVIALLFGLVIGSLFAGTPNNLVGALSKNGYIFLHCFIVLMLSAAVTLPSCFRERTTLFKHRSAEFYDSTSSYISLLLTDAPLSILEAILLALVSYFWVGMRGGAGHFFYFMGMLIALECAGQALGRLLCGLYRKQVTANSMSSVIILVFGTVGGFMPSYTFIPPILRWLSWVTPVSYAFEGLMLNEFHGNIFESVIMGSSGNEAAPVPIGGNQWLQGYDLPRASFSDSVTGVQAFDIFMVFLFAFVYDLLGQNTIERTRSWCHHQVRRPQSTVRRSFDIKMSAQKTESAESDAQSPLVEESWPSTLIGSNISYDVPLKSKSAGLNIRKAIRKITVRLAGKKVSDSARAGSAVDAEEATAATRITLLNEVNVEFKRGRMTCLMGTSGAGKTTLLDVLAGYKTGGQITGEILISGRPKDAATWRKIAGYAEQQDILNPYLSVLETLRFTAECRLPKGKDRDSVVNRVLSLMDLTEWKDYVIGHEKDGEGLPKHARKRLTIAIQLVSLPKILFLDEPTTGLGTNAASTVMNAVRAATDAMGLITLATIHQPSKTIFNSFDDVLFLTKGGRVSYMGSRENLYDYFSKLTEREFSVKSNPADFCLGVLADMSPVDAQRAFADSSTNLDLLKSIEGETERAKTTDPPKVSKERPNHPLSEMWLLTKRHAIVQWRNPSYCFMRMSSSAIMSLFLAVLFFGDKSTLQGAVFSIGAIFFLVFVLVIPMQATVVPLVEDRAVLYRETVSGCYSRLAYGIGQLLSDQPFHLLNACIMFLLFYFIVGFRVEGQEIGYFFLILYLSNWIIMSLGQLYALATPNEESANGLGGLSVMLSVILMGFLITVQAMPEGWKWAYWCNLFHYILQGLVTNELGGNDYHLDLGKILEGVQIPENLFVFDGGNLTQREQLAGLLSLVAEIPDGTNPDSSRLPALVNCTLSSGCFSNEENGLAAEFIDCYLFSGLFSDPPCTDEFNSVLETANMTSLTECFVSEDNPYFEETILASSTDNQLIDRRSSSVSNGRTLVSIPGLKPDEPIVPGEDDTSSLELVLCLAGAFLPKGALEDILETVKSLSGIAAFVFNVIDNGINIPGDLILAVFGWATFSLEDGFTAPWKWYYCMFAVAIFLAGIEAFKLASVQFIVWTKR